MFLLAIQSLDPNALCFVAIHKSCSNSSPKNASVQSGRHISVALVHAPEFLHSQVRTVVRKFPCLNVLADSQDVYLLGTFWSPLFPTLICMSTLSSAVVLFVDLSCLLLTVTTRVAASLEQRPLAHHSVKLRAYMLLHTEEVQKSRRRYSFYA